MMKRSLIASTLLALAAASMAAPKTFAIVGDKLEYRNLATVESTTEFETFTGKTTKVSGSILFDPAAKTGSGKVVVDLASLDTGIPTRNDHLRSAGWLDTDKFPTAVFQTTKVASTGGDNYRVTGQFSLHGVTKTITTRATLKYRAESEATKKAGFAGNVTHLFTKFDVKLSDYGIKIPAVAEGKVNPTVTITVSAYATAK